MFFVRLSTSCKHFRSPIIVAGGGQNQLFPSKNGPPAVEPVEPRHLQSGLRGFHTAEHEVNRGRLAMAAAMLYLASCADFRGLSGTALTSAIRSTCGHHLMSMPSGRDHRLGPRAGDEEPVREARHHACCAAAHFIRGACAFMGRLVSGECWSRSVLMRPSAVRNVTAARGCWLGSM